MSRENLELVMRALRAASARPKPDFETVNELFHPDHEFVSIPGGRLGEGVAEGAPGYKAWLQGQMDVMPFETDVEGGVDLAPDVVLTVSTVRTHGAASGIETEQRMWAVITVADGKLTRTEVYRDPAEALEAARLLE